MRLNASRSAARMMVARATVSANGRLPLPRRASFCCYWRADPPGYDVHGHAFGREQGWSGNIPGKNSIS